MNKNNRLTCTVNNCTIEKIVKPTKVNVSKFAEKQLRKLPKNILAAFSTWVEIVELEGIRVSRTYKGYHDEPLKGHRLGQRSVRLNRAYRAIYKEVDSNELILIAVLEVNKHEY